MKNPYRFKRNNYVLRSAHRDELIDLMGAIFSCRVKPDGFGIPAIFRADGTWAGSYEWGVKQLEKRGMVRGVKVNEKTAVYVLTGIGYHALSGALVNLGRVLDTSALLAEIDATLVY